MYNLCCPSLSLSLTAFILYHQFFTLSRTFFNFFKVFFIFFFQRIFKTFKTIFQKCLNQAIRQAFQTRLSTDDLSIIARTYSVVNTFSQKNSYFFHLCAHFISYTVYYPRISDSLYNVFYIYSLNYLKYFLNSPSAKLM